MLDWLLVDGYNLLNEWAELAALRRENLDHARVVFCNQIADYAAFCGYRAVVAFDAQHQPGGSETEQGGVTVVYTQSGETADSWLERRVYQLRADKSEVFVVTGDYAVQLQVLGSGAYRISSREFYQEYLLIKQQMTQQYQPEQTVRRNEVGDLVSGTVRDKLEIWRRQ